MLGEDVITISVICLTQSGKISALPVG